MIQLVKLLQVATRLVCGLCLLNVAIAQNQSDSPRPVDLSRIRESVELASQLLKEKKVLESADLVERSTNQIHELVGNASAKDLAEIKKVYEKLAIAHQILSVEGAELPELAGWEALLKTKKSSLQKSNDPQKSALSPDNPSAISFARDIAPILMENCNGCHYGATRVRGGLQFNSYTEITKGGDSGVVVLPGKPDESLIIRKLRGLEGARMPMGRPALSDSQVQLVATWIREGAVFDGKKKDEKLDQVVGQAFAATATHNELMTNRIERSRQKWKTAFPKGEPDEAKDEQFHVIGNIGEENAITLRAQANRATNQIRKMFKISSKEPLIKGGITIFALKQRYDYSEFGKMIENRALPPEWSSHWRSEVIDSYVAIVFDKAESKINETSLVQQLTSLWISSHDGVPRWFSEGAGRQALAITVGLNDARVQPWIKRLPASMQQLKTLKSLSDGTMNDEALATIGFGVIHTIYEEKMKIQFETIVRSLADGMSFEQATLKTIGPMDAFLQKLLGRSK